MKKVLCLVVAFFAICFSGCMINQEEKILEGVQLTVGNGYLENGVISYKIVNTMGEKVYVTLIPSLAARVDSEWNEIPIEGVGFCGVPDDVEREYEGEILLSWYGELSAGEYRLSYSVVDGRDYRHIATISDEFTIE